jgi:hypothetical protein
MRYLNPSRLFPVTLAMLALLMSGCASENGKGGSKAPQPASGAELAKIRAAYSRAYPESRVGLVIASRPQDRLVAVGDVKGADFEVNQVVTFIDSTQQVLTTGTVVRVLPDSVHIRYGDPDRDGREPRVGDVMVKTPYGSGTL